MSSESGAKSEKPSRDDVFFEPERQRLRISYSEGFFSNCGFTLGHLSNIYPAEKLVVPYWDSQIAFRDPDQEGLNLFTEYFAVDPSTDPKSLSTSPRFGPHGIYEDLPFAKLRPYLQAFFTPAESVLERQRVLAERYSIDPENTVAFCYRGTDKWIEVAPISLQHYYDELEQLLQRHPRLRLLVQTDQAQVRDDAMRRFGPRAFYLDEMPVTVGTAAIHQVSVDERGLSNFQFGQTLLAVVHLLAQCAYVVTHTGNMGLWITLYRGGARNLCQLRPAKPEIISDFDFRRTLKRRLLKQVRKHLLQ